MTHIATPCPYQNSNEVWAEWIQHIEKWCHEHDIPAKYLYVQTDRQGSKIIWEIEDKSHASLFMLKWAGNTQP